MTASVVVGRGGYYPVVSVNKKADRVLRKRETRAKIVPARMLDMVGIAGAALATEAVPRTARSN